MRTVYSSAGPAEVPAGLSEQIRELVGPGCSDGWHERETYLLSGKEQVYSAQVFSYHEPGSGRLRWACCRWERAGSSSWPTRRSQRRHELLVVEDTEYRESAVARYEQVVREDFELGRAAHGDGFAFDSTDVPGVPGYEKVPCDVCGRQLGEGRIEVAIDRKGAPTLHRRYCSRRHFRHELARPLPEPSFRRRPRPRPPRMAVDSSEGLGCVWAMLAVCVLLLLLPVGKALGLVWW